MKWGDLDSIKDGEYITIRILDPPNRRPTKKKDQHIWCGLYRGRKRVTNRLGRREQVLMISTDIRGKGTPGVIEIQLRMAALIIPAPLAHREKPSKTLSLPQREALKPFPHDPTVPARDAP